MATGVAEPTIPRPDEQLTIETMADVLDRLGGISADRVLTRPASGTATEADLLRLPDETQKICELIDNTLVVKAVRAPESELTMNLVGFLKIFLNEKGMRGLIRILGPDGHPRNFGGNIRMPDVAIIRRDELPDGKIPKDQQVCPVSPAWAVEVLSPGNTKREIAKKAQHLFRLGSPTRVGRRPETSGCSRAHLSRRILGSPRNRHSRCDRHPARFHVGRARVV